MLTNNLVYEPPKDDLEKEEDVLELLNDVGINLHYIGLSAPEASLKEFLKIIDYGKYTNKENEFIYNSVNLSKAQSLINDYREKSTSKGCKSCKNISIYNPNKNDEMIYCKSYEIPEKIERNDNAPDYGSSPRINKFHYNGCDKKESNQLKTIEQIIKENSKF